MRAANFRKTTTNKMIKGKTKVDSVRLSIPLTECVIIDTNLIDRIQVQTTNTETGVVVSETYRNGQPSIIENTDGTYLKFWKENQFMYVNGERIPNIYLTFLVNSKHLKQRYFEGITTETLPIIYDYIMSFNIVSFTYDSLLKSRYNDTDICVDFTSTLSTFEELKKRIKETTTQPTKWYGATEKNNSGIWTPTKSKPRDNAKPSAPFIKLYSKDEDFTYQSVEFSKEYLSPLDYTNLFRCEVTIKNATHKKHLSIHNQKEFGQFLKLDLQLLLQQIVKEYFKTENKIILNKSDLTPTDKVIIDLVNELISRGAKSSTIFQIFDRVDVSRPIRKALREKYHKFMELEKFHVEQLQKNEDLNDVFSYLGIN